MATEQHKVVRFGAGEDPKGIKTNIHEVVLRKYDGQLKGKEIVAYDNDNCYPQRQKILSDSSVMAKTCKQLLTAFTYGTGFTGGNVLLNEKQTANKILKRMSVNLSDFGGVALWIGYNALLEIDSIKPLNFDMVRLTASDSEKSWAYAVHPDWANLKNKKFDDKLIDYIDKFDPNRLIIQEQIKRAGGFDKWRGQVLWIPYDFEDSYPLTLYDHATKSIEIDAEIDLFKFRNAKTSFLAYYILMLKQGFASEQEELEFEQQMKEFQGGRNAAKIMTMKNVNPELAPELQKVDINNNDKLFEYHETSAQHKIRIAFRAPKELVGEESASGFDTERIQQARDYYNSITEQYRDFMQDVFSMVLPFCKAEMQFDNTINPLYSGL